VAAIEEEPVGFFRNFHAATGALACRLAQDGAEQVTG
jgi:hypothetical protein